MVSCSIGINTLASPRTPSIQHSFAKIHSTKCPIVIREGMACGFIIISGRMPSFVYGIFSSGITIPITPFCPCLEQCLSPNSGFLIFKKRTLQMVESLPAILSDLYTLSTFPNNELSVDRDMSVYIISFFTSVKTPFLYSFITSRTFSIPTIITSWPSGT